MKKKYHNGDISAIEDEEYENKPKWFDEIPRDPKNFEKINDQALIELKDEAKKILDSEIANYNIKNTNTNPDYKWMKSIMTKGTVSDKIAAYTVMIQDNPVYNLETIRNVVGQVKVGKKKECVAIIETLTELFLSDLLRPDEKLKSFYDRPLALLNELSSGNVTTRKKYLSYWYFEDQLREIYNTFVQALNKAAHDTVDSSKEKAIAAMSKLLAGAPEQERNLLSHIVNKMGDPSQKIASKTMYCLMQVLQQHSNMQGVILVEIEKMLFRPNIGHRAQYYSLCFISQFYLNKENPEVARKLIEVYFSFFKKCTKENKIDTRMMSVLLIGVHRAYPYADMELASIAEHIDTVYRIVHVTNFSVSLNALTLLFQVSQCSNDVNDRFYSALYRKLLDPNVATCTNQAMLLNLIYKSIMRDTKIQRVAAFIKRILQIALNVQPNLACGILYLISQVLTSKTEANLLEIKASKLENFDDDTDDDGEENYTDVKDDENEPTAKQNEVEKQSAGWVYRKTSSKNSNAKKEKKTTSIYDPTLRNPLYAKAEESAYLELNELKNHYHPTVRLFAENILDGTKVIYSGDPLKDFTLIRFLERFVFKNPKRSEELPTVSTFAQRSNYQPQGIRAINVFSNEYLLQNKESIPVDELFLYNYLQKKYRDRAIKEGNDSDDDSDLESVASDDFEDMLNKMSGFKDDDEDDDIDYMHEVGENIKQNSVKKKKSKATPEGDSDEDDGSNDDDLDDEDDGNHISDDDDEDDLEMNDEDRELLGDLTDDDDDEALFFDSDEDDKKNKKKSKKMLKKSSSGSVFASADEFASLLEEEGASKVAPGSSNQYANEDKAAAKQLDWEEKRNRWIKGYDNAVGGKRGGKGKKRPIKSNNHDRSKKGKKVKK